MVVDWIRNRALFPKALTKSKTQSNIQITWTIVKLIIKAAKSQSSIILLHDDARHYTTSATKNHLAGHGWEFWSVRHTA
ncbi:hypothetical protein KIN20_029593 [Parelaphostrongylus tenuis]|uniref:Uncharacterized protein n=1 Tax=Parelaphostrongylus tenuis TaxID=148309 RepID=A0AAD5R2N9_PARTN|nr:hypothetical protein KIN20_029593 [Parelaphostrongylus tenuis]